MLRAVDEEVGETRISIAPAESADADEETVVVAVPSSSNASSSSTTAHSVSTSSASAMHAVFPGASFLSLPAASSDMPSHAYPDKSCDDSDTPACRICFEGDSDGELIVPCLCSGSSQWVHRQCLDSWRAVSVSQPAFRRCTTCMFHYVYERPLVAPSTWHTIKCRLLVVRDLLGIVLLIQLWLILLAAIIGAFDSGAGHHLSHHFSHISPNSLYYLFSVLVSLALFGVFGLLASVFGWDQRLLGRAASFSDGSDGSNCNCVVCNPTCPDFGGGGGGSDDGGCCFALCMLLLLVFAVLGLVYGLVYGSVLVERTVGRHMRKGWYWPVVEKYRVVDWKYKLNELRAHQHPMAI